MCGANSTDQLAAAIVASPGPMLGAGGWVGASRAAGGGEGVNLNPFCAGMDERCATVVDLKHQTISLQATAHHAYLLKLFDRPPIPPPTPNPPTCRCSADSLAEQHLGVN